MTKVRYCCPYFEHADRVNKIFDHVLDEDGAVAAFQIRGESIIPVIGILYCPWCSQEVPWKEKL